MSNIIEGITKDLKAIPKNLKTKVGDMERPFQVGPVDKLTFSVFISAYFLKCSKKLVKTTGLAGGLFCPYKGLLPAYARKAY